MGINHTHTYTHRDTHTSEQTAELFIYIPGMVERIHAYGKKSKYPLALRVNAPAQRVWCDFNKTLGVFFSILEHVLFKHVIMIRQNSKCFCYSIKYVTMQL